MNFEEWFKETYGPLLPSQEGARLYYLFDLKNAYKAGWNNAADRIEALEAELGVTKTARHADAEYIGHLQAENARLRDACNKAAWALQPFSDCVFNDNGDLTVTPSTRCTSYNALTDAYFAYRAVRPAQRIDGMNLRHKVFTQELQEKLKQVGVVLPLETCYQAWRDYSEDSCAGWVYHKDLKPQDILERMAPYIRN